MLLTLCCTLAQAQQPSRQRLLVAYVGYAREPDTRAGDAAELARRQRTVSDTWHNMQLEYPRWSLRCLLVAGSGAASAPELAYTRASSRRATETSACASLTVRAPASEWALRRGHTVHALMLWLGQQRRRRPRDGGDAAADGAPMATPRFDYLLKAELSTVICFSLLTDLIGASAMRHGGGSRLYLGQLETCTRVEHVGLARRGDERHDAAYLDEVLNRKDATCYPPYMQGFG